MYMGRVCMYVCMHIWNHECMFVCMYRWMLYVCRCVCMHACTDACMYVGKYMTVCMYANKDIYIAKVFHAGRICMYACMYVGGPGPEKLVGHCPWPKHTKSYGCIL